MMRGLLIIAVAFVGMSTPSDASRKPCRGADGKIIPCPKPSPVPLHRCKDAQGRFAPCDHPPSLKREGAGKT